MREMLRHYMTKKNAIIGSFIILGLVISSIVFSIVYRNSDQGQSMTGTRQNETTNVVEYQTILPQGKTIEQLGGWRRVSPAEAAPVYAYNDQLDTVSINVSQQPLPDSFIGDSDEQVRSLAEGFNARTQLDADATTVYIGSSSNGPQSVIFTKNSLLITIKSDAPIEDSSWVRYVNSLR